MAEKIQAGVGEVDIMPNMGWHYNVQGRTEPSAVVWLVSGWPRRGCDCNWRVQTTSD